MRLQKIQNREGDCYKRATQEIFVAIELFGFFFFFLVFISSVDTQTYVCENKLCKIKYKHTHANKSKSEEDLWIIYNIL